MSIRNRSVTFFATCSVVFISGLCFAQNSTSIHTAAECMLSPANTGVLTRTSLGAVQSTDATNDLQVLCPFTRYEDSSYPLDVKVYVNDAHIVESISCYAVCYDFETLASSTSSTVTSSNGYNTITISNTGYQDGSCGMKCVVPNVITGTSSLISYYVEVDTP
jgi:hypothetical protein